MGDHEKVDTCEACKDLIGTIKFFYSCLQCDGCFHAECVNLSKEVTLPCHSDPLYLITFDSLTNDAEKTCILCGIQPKNMLYHCSVCNFTTCLSCTRNPPPLIIDHTKTHKHPLTIFPKKISWVCNVCGIQDSVMPYVCLQCGFMIHGGCIDLPRVININRHNDRISFTHRLGLGYSKCGVCRESLCQYVGAYICSVCPNYAVHSQCAIRSDIWDGIELEGTPEEDDDIAPFKVVGENLIIHSFHPKHVLRYHNKISNYDSAQCEACLYQVGFDPIYRCEECCYFLHEKCANLPLKKKLVFDVVPYALKMLKGTSVLDCLHCRLYSSGGYMYVNSKRNWISIDVLCGMLAEPFIHDCHSHPLYFDKKEGHYCNACEKAVQDWFMLSCDIEVCDFDLCLRCASLPKMIKHNNDKHPLTLCCGEKTNGKYWCDICETGLDPSKWFYTCSDCSVTLHVKCVLGDFSRLRPGNIIDLHISDIRFEVVANNHNSRPFCSWCHSRCKVDVIIKYRREESEENGYICSRFCFMKSFFSSEDSHKLPWDWI